MKVANKKRANGDDFKDTPCFVGSDEYDVNEEPVLYEQLLTDNPIENYYGQAEYQNYAT